MDKNELFEQAFNANKNHMYRAARKVGASHVQAQDAVSYALERLVAMQDTILWNDENKVRGLFCAMSRQMARNQYAKLQRDEARNEYLEISRMQDASDIDRALWVHKALSKLTEVERYIAWRYWGLEFSLQEVCEDLKGRGIEWTRQNLHKYLRKTLKPKLRSLLTSLTT